MSAGIESPLDPARTACLIVHFGDPGLTAKALSSVASGSAVPGRVIVIDNGPAAFDLQLIPDSLPATVLRSSGNVGFAAAVESAVERIDREATDWIWLLNNDAWVSGGALASLLASEEALRGRGLISSLILEDPGGEIWFERARFVPWRLEGRHERIGRATSGLDIVEGRPSARGVPYVPGCSLLVPLQLWHEIGGFNTTFFLYGEDIDLCARATAAGWTLAVDRRSIVHHRSSSGTDRATRERMMASTSVRLTARYFPWVLPIGLPVAILTGVKRAVGRRAPWWVTSRILGYLDALGGGHPGTAASRARNS